MPALFSILDLFGVQLIVLKPAEEKDKAGWLAFTSPSGKRWGDSMGVSLSLDIPDGLGRTQVRNDTQEGPSKPGRNTIGF